MHPGHAQALLATALLLFCHAAGLAQTPTPMQRAVKVAKDSILCTASASQQQQRACKRLDSIVTTPASVPIASPVCALPACNPGSPGNTGYEVRILAAPPEDDVPDSTFCARVERQDGKVFVGYWPIWREPTAIKPDSATFKLRSGTLTLPKKCGLAFTLAGYALPADSIPILWVGDWITVNGKRSWRPFASVVP